MNTVSGVQLLYDTSVLRHNSRILWQFAKVTHCEKTKLLVCGEGLKLLVYEALSYWCIRLDCFRLDRIGQQTRLLVYEVYNYWSMRP